ncbi:MAG: transposase [Saprospiraceae bacterium]|nr:transposase [Saprospiraceae bacterium]
MGFQYNQTGSRLQNGYIERFNLTYQRDLLDAWLFFYTREAAERFVVWKTRCHI